MMRRTISLAVLASLVTASPGVQALGLSEPQVQSSLSEPLRAHIALTNLGGMDPSHLRVGLADAQAYAKAGLSRSALAESVQMALNRADGKLAVLLTTERAVREPYLDLLLSLEWPNGELQRQVTLLLDPPGYASTTSLVETSGSRTPASRKGPSSLPGAPMMGQSAVTAPEDGRPQRVEVQPGDTLWNIAERISPPETAIEQAMVALFRANPEAFPGNNINDLRAGTVLTVPSRQAMTEGNPAAAQRVVQAHHAAWQAGQSTAEEDALADPPRLTLLSDAELAAERGESLAVHEPVNPPGDSIEEGRAVAKADSMESRLAALEANWQASRNALEQVRLERNRLQQEIESLREDVAALRERLVTASVPSGSEEGAKPAASTGASIAVPAEAPVSAPEISDERHEVGTWQERWQGARDWLSLIGGGVMALLLLAWVVLRRLRYRREQDGGEPAYSFQQIMGEGIGASAAVVDAPGSASSHHAAAMGSAPQAEAINEADIFIAYGRYEQARDLLEKSLESEPERHDLRLKLLTAYAELNDREAAQREAGYLSDHAGPVYRKDAQRLMASFETESAPGHVASPESDSSGNEAAPADASQPQDALKDDSLNLIDEEVARIEDEVEALACDAERIIDYEPPSLDPAPSPRSDDLRQPGIDYPGRAKSAAEGRVADMPGFEDADWEIEEVAFEPLNLDNERPAAGTSNMTSER